MIFGYKFYINEILIKLCALYRNTENLKQINIMVTFVRNEIVTYNVNINILFYIFIF